MVASLLPGIVAPGAGAAAELRSSKRRFPRTIERISLSGREAVIAFSGVRSISEALRFVGCSLYAEVPAARKSRAGSMIGYRVCDLQGNCWGTVKAQPRFSLNELLEIEDHGSGETVFVPWHESLVVRIDRRGKVLVIDPPAGLRDLNK